MRARRAKSVSAFAATLALLALSAAGASAAPPAISNLGFSSVTETSVTLEAQILPSKRTSYHFEYGAADCSLPAANCTNVPALDSKIDPAEGPIPVSATVEGLTPGTTYHYRLVARNTSTPTEVTESPDATFTTYHTEQAFGPCPNDALRSGAGARLPDCRAYEQASPVDKDGSDVSGDINQVQASVAGDAITFFVPAGIPGALGSQDFQTYLSRRGAGGWSTSGVFPPPTLGSVVTGGGWSEDLSTFLLNTGENFKPPFTIRARTTADGAFTTLHDGGREGILVAISADHSKLFFQSADQLTPEAIGGKENLYLYDNQSGVISLISQIPSGAATRCGGTGLPCGAPPDGAFAGPYYWFGQTDTKNEGLRSLINVQYAHAISSDGARAYFTVAGTGQLYLRRGTDNPSPETVQVSASRRTVPDPLGTRPAAFMGATPDGSKAFFTSPEKLTDDANTGPEPAGLPAIARAGIDGNGTKQLSFLPTRAKGLAVADGYLYWANPVAGTIGRAKLNAAGEATEPKPDFIAPGPTEAEAHPKSEPGVLTSAPSRPQYVAVEGEYIYWSNPGPLGSNVKGEPERVEPVDGAGTIGRAKLVGAGVAEVKPDFINGASNPQGIAASTEYIYWGNSGANNGNHCTEIGGSCSEIVYPTRTLGRANIGGTQIDERFVPLSGQLPMGLAIDSSHLYLAVDVLESNGDFLTSFNLDGSTANIHYLETHQASRGVAVNAAYVYWASLGDTTIGRANLALGEAQPEFIKDAGGPTALALESENLYWGANQQIPPNPGNDLYRFDADSPSGALTDLTPDTNPADLAGADVRGVLGISADGSTVYFAANGDLDGPGGPAAPGNCRDEEAFTAYESKGTCSIYRFHAGEITFIAPVGSNIANLSGTDAANWAPKNSGSSEQNTARVSADGQTLLFRSRASIGAYENQGVSELYRYHVGEGVSCVSCVPSGAPPLGPPTLTSITVLLSTVDPGGSPPIFTRNLSSDGSEVFFESPDKLVAADINGEGGCPPQQFHASGIPLAQGVRTCQDVYEWEAPGSGSCQAPAENDGCLYLLSTGTSSDPAFFADASASGKDAFIFSREQLVPQDTDNLRDIYDVRVDGGLVSQHFLPPSPCESEGCRGAIAPVPSNPAPTTSGFHGPPNPKVKRPPCPKRSVRGKGKCGKQGKRHSKRRSAKRVTRQTHGGGK